MKNLKNLLIISIISIVFASCSVTMPFAVTNNEIGGKRGMSTNVCILSPPMKAGSGPSGVSRMGSSGMCLNSNYGLQEAIKRGRLEEAIGSVDIKTTNYVFFTRYQMIVTGK